jgi:hypothetical protein
MLTSKTQADNEKYFGSLNEFLQFPLKSSSPVEVKQDYRNLVPEISIAPRRKYFTRIPENHSVLKSKPLSEQRKTSST